MTGEQIQKISNFFESLEKFEIDQLFVRTPTGVQTNAKEFNLYNKQLRKQDLIELYAAMETNQQNAILQLPSLSIVTL